jgi:hypothetical protein
MNFLKTREPVNVFDKTQPKLGETSRARKFEKTPLMYQFDMTHVRKQGEYELPQYFTRFSNETGEFFNGYGLGSQSDRINVLPNKDMIPPLPEGMAPKRFYK